MKDKGTLITAQPVHGGHSQVPGIGDVVELTVRGMVVAISDDGSVSHVTLIAPTVPYPTRELRVVR